MITEGFWMKQLQVVIGANFGDEGKGLITDYLAANSKEGIVIRFNGGAQAGHTVVTPDGMRHVFGHFGAGSLAGLPTYFSSFFVVHPLLFQKEAVELKQLGFTPEVYVDPSCLVTTPYDILLNQVAELIRGTAKHGSCGVGFNETITRSLADEAYRITVADLGEQAKLRQKLDLIKKEYLPERFLSLGIKEIPDKYQALLDNENLPRKIISDFTSFFEIVNLAELGMLNSFETLIFEGAQGLLLDQSYPYFPHVTRSNTGVKNVVSLLKELNLSNESLEIIYVTRAYLTRHGAGPFPGELLEKPYPEIEDLTNVPNPYQDSLRYGLLDLNDLQSRIRLDLKNITAINYKLSIALTCLDQISDQARYLVNGVEVRTSYEILIKKINELLLNQDFYFSFGDTRAKISKIKRS